MSLVSKVVKWILSKVMPTLVKIGGGPDKMFDMLLPSIPGLTKSLLAGSVRSYEKAAQTSETIQSRPVENLFEIGDLIETDMALTRRYMVKYRFEIYDREKGETRFEYRNVYDTKLRSIDDWISRGNGQFERLFERYNIEILDTKLQNVYHKETWKH